MRSFFNGIISTLIIMVIALGLVYFKHSELFKVISGEFASPPTLITEPSNTSDGVVEKKLQAFKTCYGESPTDRTGVDAGDVLV